MAAKTSGHGSYLAPMGAAWARVRGWARTLKRDTYALYLAARDPRTPVLAKIVAALVAAYAFSPFDLIPDFVPIVGYLDDVVIVPLGIYLAIRLVPPDVMAECRQRAEQNRPVSKPVSWVAGGLMVTAWVLVAALAVRVAWRALAWR